MVAAADIPALVSALPWKLRVYAQRRFYDGIRSGVCGDLEDETICALRKMLMSDDLRIHLEVLEEFAEANKVTHQMKLARYREGLAFVAVMPDSPERP